MEKALRIDLNVTSGLSAVDMAKEQYRAALGSIITRSRLAQSLPQLEDQEMDLTIEAWAEILWNVVPVEKLNNAYLETMRTRKSTWPLSASEICVTWSEMRHPSFMAPPK
jgi:hypothetical protein